MDIFIPILALGTLGLFFGVGLAVAAKKLKVKVDPRLEKIYGLLPGANCGACGGAGCFGFAESLLSGKLSLGACRVAEEKSRQMIAEILGQELKEKVKMTASSHCNGGKKVKERFIYQGIKDCVSANVCLGGQKDCVWGCLGLGDCVRVCPFGAIKMTDDGLPEVDKDKCVGCNRCVEACPKKLFTLIPSEKKIYVACSSCDSGKDTKAACPVGCIACRKCEKACPYGAIHIVDNLAVIDYNKCTSCGECVKVCPMNTIRIRE
ncbi:MAG: RnfABCDGE type electron transport complex subunit B [Candidatus Omnitrophica bacterium]|nr:RnfABCDGE type electron transport complex subunit B [Candidatus Omnitrophota bacterium]